MKTALSRREFIKIASVSGIGVALAACAPKTAQPTAESGAEAQPEVTQPAENATAVPQAEPAVLKFRCDTNPEMIAEFNQAAEEYRDIDPTIKIEITEEAAPSTRGPNSVSRGFSTRSNRLLSN